MDYLEHLRADGARLGAVARRGPEAAVPSCPGWTVDDAVRHVAQVYVHKVEVLKHGALPDPWPLEFSGLETFEWYDEMRAAIVAALEEAGTERITWTFSPRDSTSGFWYRRMAHETVIHRVDVEQAFDAVTPIDLELALDGIDEVLYPTVGGPWWEEGDTKFPVDATVRIAAGSRSWTIQANATAVDVHQDAAGLHAPADAGTPASSGEQAPAVEVSGDPMQVYLWLWGRAGDDAVQVTGDLDVLRAFRGRVSEATQ
ncbi:maleylpyruvate isomerase family mycothiol-dependent enzyme [Kribbella hippodromi]|uniref:Maleylpyruvate isomerase family mycothiol-dependent enzyme n=1 Tax=Kribbella hippodromi TaxID=434347 RepID=A0ABN2D8N3_9ACTN